MFTPKVKSAHFMVSMALVATAIGSMAKEHKAMVYVGDEGIPAGAFGAPEAPAPALTNIYIVSVTSAQAGSEPIGMYQMATTRDHGGSYMRVVVDEIGYGSGASATVNGVPLPSSALISDKPFCSYVYGNYVPCYPGQTVIGWRKEWRLDGKTGGQFRHQNISMNSPWNTASDFINIK